MPASGSERPQDLDVPERTSLDRLECSVRPDPHCWTDGGRSRIRGCGSGVEVGLLQQPGWSQSDLWETAISAPWASAALRGRPRGLLGAVPCSSATEVTFRGRPGLRQPGSALIARGNVSIASAPTEMAAFSPAGSRDLETGRSMSVPSTSSASRRSPLFRPSAGAAQRAASTSRHNGA